MVQSCVVESSETVTGLNCKWYSVVLRNVERMLLGLNVFQLYSVVVRNVERNLLGLTD